MSLQCLFCFGPTNTCSEKALTSSDLTDSLLSLFTWTTPFLARSISLDSFCTKCSVSLATSVWNLQKIQELTLELDKIKNDLETTLWNSRDQLQSVFGMGHLARVDLLKGIALKKGQIFEGPPKDPVAPSDYPVEYILPDPLTLEGPPELDEDHLDLEIKREPEEISQMAVVQENKRSKRSSKKPPDEIDLDPYSNAIRNSNPRVYGRPRNRSKVLERPPDPPDDPEDEDSEPEEPVYKRKTPKKPGDDDEDWEPHKEAIKNSGASGTFVERDPFIVEDGLKEECLKSKPIVMVRRMESEVLQRIKEYEKEEEDWIKLKRADRLNYKIAAKRKSIRFKFVLDWIPRVTCKTCKKKFTGDDRKEQLAQHYIEVHPRAPDGRNTSRIHKCAICGASFHSKARLETHCANLHNPRQFSLSYPCPHEGCSRTYRKNAYLQFHIKKHHGLKPPPLEYPCIQCDEIFGKKQNLTNHLKKIHKVLADNICEICGVRLFDIRAFQRHVKLHGTGESVFNCDLCPAKFSYQKLLDAHKICHTGSRIHNCTQCSGTYFTLNALKHHIRYTHDVQRYPCEVCGKIVKNLERHQKQIHEKEFNYFCPKSDCNRGYFHQTDLDRHLKNHPGSFSYTCRYCPKAFSAIAGRISHERAVHNQPGAFQCHMCPLICPTRTHLTRHLATTHSNEKSFKCGDCGMAFKIKYYLQRHQKGNCGSKKSQGDGS